MYIILLYINRKTQWLRDQWLRDQSRSRCTHKTSEMSAQLLLKSLLNPLLKSLLKPLLKPLLNPLLKPLLKPLFLSLICFGVLIGGCDEGDQTPETEESGAGTEELGVAGEQMGGVENISSLPQARFEVDPDIAATLLSTIPFPHDAYRTEDGTLDLRGFPRVEGILRKLVDSLEAETAGFGTTSGHFISFLEDIDVSKLPTDGGESLRDDSVLSLIDVDEASPEFGRRWPIYWKYFEEESAYLPSYSLSIRLLEGIALRPNTKYALILTQEIASPSSNFIQMLSELEPEEVHLAHLWSLYAPLRAWLLEQGETQPPLALASIFTTQDPTSELFKLRDFLYTLPAPEAREIESIGVQRGPVDYEIFNGRYTAPRFQEGEIPYQTSGGAIRFDDDGTPIIQGEEELRFSISAPLSDMPEEGWPVVLYAHGTGGNYQSYYRGDVAVSLARKGIAVIGIDQIHHGTRDAGKCHGDVDYSQCVSLLFFNFLVPNAGRDNVRQSALDFVSLMRMVETINISPDLSREGKEVRLNPNKVMFMGHSQGGLNGPIFLAIEPNVLGGVLSGAGSNIAISMEQKTKPFNVNQLVRAALGVPATEELTRWHPALTLLQTFIEPGDSANYSRFWFSEPPEGFKPKSIFMTVGLKDKYTPPDTTFSLAVSGRVPIIEPVYQPIAALDFLGINSSGRPPFSANVAEGNATAGLAQYENEGHFLIFNIPSAKERYGNFLRDLAQRPPPQIY